MEPELVKQMGARIREERLKRHWTQKELTEHANVLWLEKFPDHPPMQEKWLWTLEHAKITSTNLDWLAALAGALGVSLDTLLRPSPVPEGGVEAQRLRMVMRMHGVSSAVVEDIIHSIRLIEESESASDAPSKPSTRSKPRSAPTTSLPTENPSDPPTPAE